LHARGQPPPAGAAMQPGEPASCPACSAARGVPARAPARSGQRPGPARRALLAALCAVALCAALLTPAHAAEEAAPRGHKEHVRSHHHHHKRRNGKELSGRALTDSGGSSPVWYRKAGEVGRPRPRQNRGSNLPCGHQAAACACTFALRSEQSVCGDRLRLRAPGRRWASISMRSPA